AATQRQLKRGERTVELLKQGLNQPLSVQEQISVLKINSEGLLDDLEVSQIQEFEKEFLETVRVKYDDEMKALAKLGKLSDEFGLDLLVIACAVTIHIEAEYNSYFAPISAISVL